MSQSAARRTVLLVDDDTTVRQTLGRFLGLEGFSVIEAENGQDALAQLRAGCGAAAIVLDLRMPVMDGFAFRRAQRSDPSIAAIPVIVLSGADSDRFHELAAFGVRQTGQILGRREPTADPLWHKLVSVSERRNNVNTGVQAILLIDWSSVR